MRTRPCTSLAAGVLAGSIAFATPAASQTTTATPDSAHRFALFGGTAATESAGPEGGYELGVSGDFRWRPVPVPLRLSLSFSQINGGFPFESKKGGKASLDVVMRPFPRKLGIRPYFLAGLGVATRDGFDAWYGASPISTVALGHAVRPRQTWAFASAGVGLDIGRAFIQVKLENPVASQGPIVVPLNIGFRFWD